MVTTMMILRCNARFVLGTIHPGDHHHHQSDILLSQQIEACIYLLRNNISKSHEEASGEELENRNTRQMISQGSLLGRLMMVATEREVP